MHIHTPIAFDHNQLQVLHQDNHTMVVFKPARVPVQGDSSGDPCLLEAVRQYIATQYHKTGNVFVGMVQRLDRPVSGLVVFARTSKGASRLCAQIREHQLQKYYLALVHGQPPALEGTLVDQMDYEGGSAILAKSDGKRAALDYRVLAAHQDTSLLHIRLHTGRKHQIRFQLSRIGCPLVGDLRYGAPRPLADQSIALCAWALAYEHPTSKQRICVRLPEGLLPKRMRPWAEVLPNPFVAEDFHGT